MSASTYLAWYRPAVTAKVVRVALLSAVVMTLGMACLGAGLWSPRVPDAARPFLEVGGGLATLFGPISAVVRLHGLLVREEFIGLRNDGLELELASARAFVPWDELLEARAVGEHLALRLRDGRILHIAETFLGETHAGIARELETTRRRAGLGLLRPRRTS